MTVFGVLIVIALVMVLGSLAMGLVSMVRGGEAGSRNSQRFMRLRVITQFLALALLVLAFAMRE